MTVRFYYYNNRFDGSSHFDYGHSKKVAGRWKCRTLADVKQNDTVLVWTNKKIAVGKVLSSEVRVRCWPPGNEKFDTVDVEWQGMTLLTERVFEKDSRCCVWNSCYKLGKEESFYIQNIGNKVVQRILNEKSNSSSCNNNSNKWRPSFQMRLSQVWPSTAVLQAPHLQQAQ